VLILRYKKLEKSETFISINRFTLSKFKSKFFFWDLFDSIRKASFSILTVFFKPMFLITAGIALVFTGMLMHINFIPYKKKFHNLMEYFILMSTLLTLFAGLLLYVVDRNGGTNVVINESLRDVLTEILPIITVALIVISNVVVISMFLFDVYVRRNKEKQRVKKLKKSQQEEKEHEEKLTNVLDDLHGNAMNQRQSSMVPWETEHDFQFKVKLEEISDLEDDSKSMNDILADVFSYGRAKRRIISIKNETQKRVSTLISKIKKEKSEDSKKLVLEKRRTYDMPNGFTIRSDYPGSVSYVQTLKGQLNRYTFQRE
jgi:hypothetical protein